MKIVGHELGRTIVVFPMEEIRPKNGIPALNLIEGIRHRYKFAKTPDLNRPIVDINQEGITFESGSFTFNEEPISIREFTIYTDGISVSCLDTSHADAAFNDILTWAKEEFGLRDFVREPRKIYRSQVIVEFEKPLNQLIEGFSELSRAIQHAYSQYTEHDDPIDLNRIDFRMDDTKIPGIAPITFILERRAGISHETERFISEAPIPSRAHLQLLQTLEDALS